MIVQEATWNDLKEYRSHLEHYGVKGMRWGHRKEKTTSGSNKKKKTISKKLRSKRETRAKKRLEKAKLRAKKEAAKKEAQRKKILSNPTSLYRHRKEFSYDEIQNAMRQFEWEQKLQNYSKNRLNNGADYIKTLTNYTINGINLYNQAVRIANAVQGDDKLPYIKTANTNSDKDKKK